MKKEFGIILTVVFVLIILFLISCPIINNVFAKRVASDIESVPLPPNTQMAEKFSKAGKLTGNGNGMQFFGAVLIESQLSSEELNKYYSSYRKTEWDYIVAVQDTQNIDEIEHGDYSFETDVSNGQFYIVYSWGDGVSPFQYFDLRGH